VMCRRFKVMQSNAEGTGSFTVTTTASNLFGLSGIALNSAIARVMVDLVAAHARAHGDGGLFVMALCSRLVHTSLQMNLHDAMPSHTMLRAYSLGLRWCVDYLSDTRTCPCVIPVKWSEMGVLVSAVRYSIQNNIGAVDTRSC
jgi:hypothetical protein